jgi:hypothetical protein
MKTFIRQTLKTNLVILGVIVMTAAAPSNRASAAVIFSQDFTGGNATLAGTTSTTGNGTWAGNDILTLNGNTNNGPNFNGAVSLAFAPSSGFIYDLTATINVSAGTDFLGVGFLNANNVYGFFAAQNTPTTLQKATLWENWPAGGTTSRTSNNVLIRLDTTGAQWTTSVFQGGVQMGSTFTYTTNPTINYVGFVMEGAGSGVTGNVSAFQLTSVVPEPSTYAMMCLGGIMLLLLNRRRAQA